MIDEEQKTKKTPGPFKGTTSQSRKQCEEEFLVRADKLMVKEKRREQNI